MRNAMLTCLLPLAVACRGTRPSSFAAESGPLVLVKEARIPDSEVWYARFATHGWIERHELCETPWPLGSSPTPRSEGSGGGRDSRKQLAPDRPVPER